MFRNIIITLVVAFLTGCTGYHNSGKYGGGGYYELPAPGSLKRIEYHVSFFSSNDRAKAFVLYRCAEISKSLNMPYFSLYESIGDAISNNKRQEVVTYNGPGIHFAHIYFLPKNEYEKGDFSVEEIYKSSQTGSFKVNLK